MPHEYDPEWDYELDENPNKAVQRLVDKYLKRHGFIFDALHFDEPPRVHFVTDLGGSHVARYINGTRNMPVIVIDIPALLDAAKEYGVEMEDAVEPTLLHEYGHAYMDATGYHEEMSEDEEEDRVEAFAHTYWMTGDINEALKQLPGTTS